MKTAPKTIFLLSLFTFLILNVTFAQTTTINECTTIANSGEYVLGQSITGSQSTSRCIDIQANNVVLDCAGYSITGNETGTTYGILLYQVSNITIKNCYVTNYTYGIYLYVVNNSNIIGKTLTRKSRKSI